MESRVDILEVKTSTLNSWSKVFASKSNRTRVFQNTDCWFFVSDQNQESFKSRSFWGLLSCEIEFWLHFLIFSVTVDFFKSNQCRLFCFRFDLWFARSRFLQRSAPDSKNFRMGTFQDLLPPVDALSESEPTTQESTCFFSSGNKRRPQLPRPECVEEVPTAAAPPCPQNQKKQACLMANFVDLESLGT